MGLIPNTYCTRRTIQARSPSRQPDTCQNERQSRAMMPARRLAQQRDGEARAKQRDQVQDDARPIGAGRRYPVVPGRERDDRTEERGSGAEPRAGRGMPMGSMPGAGTGSLLGQRER